MRDWNARLRVAVAAMASVVTFVVLAPVGGDYASFTSVVDDTIDARVFLGIHFRTADVQAAKLGKQVARWVDKGFFGPA